MESNGKRVALDGTPLLHESGEIMFGEPGTNGQHSFYQLLHQGRVVPADFIGFMESPMPVRLPGEFVSNHDELMSNFFALPSDPPRHPLPRARSLEVGIFNNCIAETINFLSNFRARKIYFFDREKEFFLFFHKKIIV